MAAWNYEQIYIGEVSKNCLHPETTVNNENLSLVQVLNTTGYYNPINGDQGPSRNSSREFLKVKVKITTLPKKGRILSA